MLSLSLAGSERMGSLLDETLPGCAWLVSPLFADLAGLPPVLIQVGSAETLLDDAVRLARALGAADVPVRLEVWPQMIHAWVLWSTRLAEGRRASETAGAFLRAQTSRAARGKQT
jgi:acetyl esterase/lipase